MIEWFRSWHGAPTDPKWLGIARKAGVAPGIAVAVAWALMDRASQAEDRGCIDGYDADGLGCFYGCEPEQVEAIVLAMAEKKMIVDGRFTSWEKRQPVREDNSTGRVRRFRERNATTVKRDETHGNAPEEDTRERKDDAVEDAPASAPKPVSEADRVTAEILEAVKVPWDHPMAIGANYAVQGWLNEGVPAEVILAACKRAMVRKRDGPPKSINYFREAVATEFARSKEKLPEVKLSPQGPINGNRNSQSRPQEPDWDAAADRLRSRLSGDPGPSPAAEAAEGRIRPEPGDLDAEAVPGLGYRVQ